MLTDFQKRLKSLMDAQGMNDNALAAMAELERSTVRKMFRPEYTLPTGKTAKALATALNVSAAYILGETDDPASHADARRPNPDDIPVLATAPTPDGAPAGAFQLSNNVISYVERTRALRNTRNLYALFVVGESMAPQYNPGDIILVSPDRPVRREDVVLLQIQKPGDRAIEATLGIFLRETDKGVVIGKRDGGAEVSIPSSQVKARHRVYTVNELLGAL